MWAYTETLWNCRDLSDPPQARSCKITKSLGLLHQQHRNSHRRRRFLNRFGRDVTALAKAGQTLTTRIGRPG